MMRARYFKPALMLLLLICLPMACATSKSMTVGATAALLEDIARSANRQSDLKLVREGMPAYLMLIDGMVEAVPNNPRLLINAAKAYASFASAFIQAEDTEYAGLLYAKSRGYAFRALEQIGFKNPASREFDDFQKALYALPPKDVPYIFWAASCWGSWISLNQRSMSAMAELPRVELMMARVLELNEGFYYGGAHIFAGILEASKPKMAGGDLEKARAHFLKAIELGNGKFLLSRVYYAEYYARKAFDRDLFAAILKDVLDTPADIEPDLTLLNTVAHIKAQKLLNNVDEYF
jgi:hypothetical protein